MTYINIYSLYINTSEVPDWHCRGRNREQITVEQKFISGFQRGRGRQAPSPVKGRGGKGNPRLLSGAGDGDL